MKVHRGYRAGFTLVELLVVIGIIALLISILLPALQSARRAAATVKCAAALKEVGNAFKMYEQEYRGYAPACKIVSGTYTLNGSTPPYWYDFLQKYVTKAKMGTSSTNSEEASQQLRTVFWGCPAWDSYTNATGTLGVNVAQPGYGMNGFPEYLPNFPANLKSIGDPSDPACLPQYANLTNQPGLGSGANWGNFQTNKWYKLKTYAIKGSERALAGDCLFWFIESRNPTTTMNPNLPLPGQYYLGNQGTWSSSDGANQSTFDWYRHGKYPGMKSGATDEFAPTGGKVSYNILFVDGHVANSVDKRDAYRTVRMKFPG